MNKKSNLYIITFVFTPFMLAYFLSELYRNVNGIIGPVLKSEFNLTPNSLGLMTSLFLAAVASSQIFTGVLLDRYGAKRTVAFLLFVGAIGSLLFSTGNFFNLLLGRFLIGIGMAGCWTAAFKVNSDWWPHERLALANGAIIGLAGLGSLAATLPTQLLLGVISWNYVFVGLAVCTIIISIILLVVVPDPELRNENEIKNSVVGELRGFLTILKNPVFIRIAPISILCQGVWLSYQGLWAGAWLREVNKFDVLPVANYLLLLAICIVVGNLFLGFIADRLSRLGITLNKSMYFACIVFIGAQCIIVSNIGELTAYAWAVFGLFLAGPIFAYALMTRAVPSNYSGRAVSLLNLLATLAGFIMQYSVGAIMTFWEPGTNGFYPIIAHQISFGIIVLLQIFALLWLIHPVRSRISLHS